jgi:hypothetical protein
VNQKGSFRLSVGASSILMIFVVLCLTTFGVLSYVTANADSKLSTKNSETVENYYAGTSAAEKVLQKIDEALFSAKLDAEQAVKSHRFTELKNYSLYKGEKLQRLEDLLRSGAPQEEQREECYRYFSETLLARIENISLQRSENQELLVRFAVNTDGREFETKLTVTPYSDETRYQITGKKLLPPLNTESDSEETVRVWTGKK